MPRRRWFVLILISVCVGVSFISIASIVLRRKAQALIREASIASQHLGQTTSIDTLQNVYGGRLNRKPDCSPAFCGYEAIQSNRVLAALHWTPYSELRSETWLRDGILSAVILDFTSTANLDHTIVAHVYIQEGRGREFDLHPWDNSSPADTNGIVGVRPESLKAHERTVLGLDTSCLTRHRGCRSIAELLPTVWSQGKDGWIRCLIQNHEGFVESPW